MNNRQISLDVAHREACLALGEAVVQQRLLAAEIGRLDAEIARLTPVTESEAEADATGT